MQAVGQFADHALQMLQLLVELLAKPGQFFRVAKVIGLDHLVEIGGEGAVLAAVINMGDFAALLRAAGLVVAFGGGAFFLGFLGLFLGGVAFHGLGLGARHRFLFLGLGLALAGLVLLGLVVAALVALVILLGFALQLGLGEVERGEQFAGGAGEGFLAVGGGDEFLHRGFGLFVQRAAPFLQDALRRLGGGLAGDTLARQQGERRMQRQLVLAGHAVIALGLALLVQADMEVVGDAFHMGGADMLDAHIFQRIEHLARFLAGGHAGGMGAFIVMAQLQGQCIGGAAQLGHFGGGEGAGGQGQAGTLAGQAGGAGLEGDLDFLLLRDGTERAGGGALEFFLTGQVLLAAHQLKNVLPRTSRVSAILAPDIHFSTDISASILPKRVS